MAGLTALSQPAVEQGSFSVIQLVSGLAVKVPVTLNAIGSGDKATFHFNRQVIQGDVPLILRDLASTAGSFWYSQSQSSVLESIDKRAFHVVKSGYVDGIKVTIDDYACIANDRFIEGPEFQLHVVGTGCAAIQSIPAKELGAWVKIGPQGIEEVALPMSDSFSLLLMLNLTSLAFYLIMSISTFKKTDIQTQTHNFLTKITKALAVASAVALVYVSSFDIVFDTQCTRAEAAAAATGLTVFFLLVGNGLTSTISSNDNYSIESIWVLISSVSLSSSVAAIDYFSSEEVFSLVALHVNLLAAFKLMVIILSRTPPYILSEERCIIELAIVSSLRTLVSAELGVFFALGVAFSSSILLFKYIKK